MTAGKIGDFKFDEIYREYYPVLVAYANKYVHDFELAREVVQELFIHLYEKNDSIYIKTNLRSYLFQSVYNRCLNELRKKKTEHLSGDTIIADWSMEADHNIETAEFEYLIFTLIEKLPDACKQIFRMSRFENLKNDEIAEKLRLSKRTVETQISKALRILRSEIYKLEETPVLSKKLFSVLF